MKGVWIILVFLSTAHLHAQELPPGTQEQLEVLASKSEDNIQTDELWLEQLDHFSRHPLNLNSASREDLLQLRILTDIQISAFITYRSLMGNLISIFELQAVPLWDLITVRKLLPYVYVGPFMKIGRDMRSRLKGEHSIRFLFERVVEKAEGYRKDSGTRYFGDPAHLQFRYRYQYRDQLYFGITAEKDAGEPFFRGAQKKGFDFYSIHVYARNLGGIKTLALGDFSLNLGQGLIEWQSLGFGKGPEVLNIKRQGRIILPYRSSGEYYFDRGLALTLQKKRIEASVFLSRKKISGHLDDSTGSFTSILTSGYHRTTSEIANANNIRETKLGGNLSYGTRQLKIGLNIMYHGFDRPLQKKVEAYNLFAYSGKGRLYGSFDYHYTYKNLHLFGEAAGDRRYCFAFIQGLLVSAGSNADIAISYRNISRGYQSLYGNAFTESNLPGNERGLYLGITIRPAYGWLLSGYADHYHFPWLKYMINAPADGRSYLLHLSYQPDRHTELYLQYRCEHQPKNAGEAMVGFPEDTKRQNIRFQVTSRPDTGMIYKARAELVWLSNESNMSEKGFLCWVEFSKDFARKFSLNCRLQYFETEGYESRVYSYEGGMSGFSIPFFYNKGLKYFSSLKYDLRKNIVCWFRLEQLMNRSDEGLGSGLDFLPAGKRTELKIQLALQL